MDEKIQAECVKVSIRKTDRLLPKRSRGMLPAPSALLPLLQAVASSLQTWSDRKGPPQPWQRKACPRQHTVGTTSSDQLGAFVQGGEEKTCPEKPWVFSLLFSLRASTMPVHPRNLHPPLVKTKPIPRPSPLCSRKPGLALPLSPPS